MAEKIYTVVLSDDFKKKIKKLSSVQETTVLKKLALFKNNPFHPSFRTKKMYVKEDYYESSINMDIRIFWYFEGDRIIVLTDVGHHDVLKKY